MKISNILSYGLLSDFDDAPNTIEFKDDLNILIGANGSGKSNLLEIINRLFQGHFLEGYSIDDNILQSMIYHSGEANFELVKKNDENNNQISNTIYKNFNHKNEQSYVEVEILPTEDDVSNLLIIFNNIEDLTSYSQKFSGSHGFFTKNLNFSKDYIENLVSDSIKYKFKVNNIDRLDFRLISEFKTKAHEVFYYYLMYFNQIQQLYRVINLVKKTNWNLLKPPFALISSTRQHTGFHNSISAGIGLNGKAQGVMNQDKNKSTKDYTDSNYIYLAANISIGQLLRSLIQKEGVSRALENLYNTDNIFTRIQRALKVTLDLDISLSTYNSENDTVFWEIYHNNKKIEFHNFSTGQRSIFYLVFCIYSYDIVNGLIIIDEPELHLHISMQKKYFNVLKSICKNSKIQSVIATHSSVFIDENTISSTFRFYKVDSLTSIVSPFSISHSQKDLIKILTYRNASRIFFSDYVILVEGDSDEYFFTFFYENHIRNRFLSDADVEILYIGGKGNFSKWKDFLDLFNINSSFIGDFDNIKEFDIIKKLGIDLNDLIHQSKEFIIAKLIKERFIPETSKDGQELFRQLDLIISKKFEVTEDDKDNLVNLWIYLIEKQGVKVKHILHYLSQTNKILLSNVTDEIVKLYPKKIFILKDGDLEEYLGIPKGLEHVISFCQNDFETWKANDESQLKLHELEAIFTSILSK